MTLSRTLRNLAIAFAILGFAAPGPAIAQSDELARVERLVDDGRFSEARTSLEYWWEQGWNDATRVDRQMGIWLRGLLTIEPGMAEMDFRRLIVEYPGGVRSDAALLRLAHGSIARGETGEARRYLDLLARDYPQSPHRAEAPSLEVVDTSGPFTIQLGAFSTESRSASLVVDAREEDLDVRVVRVEGSELVRVRLGAFMSRDVAEGKAREIRGLGFEAVVSSDREGEIPVH